MEPLILNYPAYYRVNRILKLLEKYSKFKISDFDSPMNFVAETIKDMIKNINHDNLLTLVFVHFMLKDLLTTSPVIDISRYETIEEQKELLNFIFKDFPITDPSNSSEREDVVVLIMKRYFHYRT